MSEIKLHNADCLPFMRECKDNEFDLAIVDPPYGIGFGKYNRTNKASNGERYKANKYKNSNWDDSIPSDEYFAQLIRISKNQIVWGGNYFPFLWINGCRGFIFWNKDSNLDSYSDGELAWTSFNLPARNFYWAWNGLSDGIKGRNKKEKTIHPTQKPIELYKWLLQNYAKEGDKILDTHLGSGSIACACHDLHFDLTACELDKEYFEGAKKRLKEHQMQLSLF